MITRDGGEGSADACLCHQVTETKMACRCDNFIIRELGPHVHKFIIIDIDGQSLGLRGPAINWLLFFYPAHEVVGEYCHHHVWPCVCESHVFRFWTISWIPLAGLLSFRTISCKAFAELFSYCTHTSRRGWRWAFWGVMTFDLIFYLRFCAGLAKTRVILILSGPPEQ